MNMNSRAPNLWSKMLKALFLLLSPSLLTCFVINPKIEATNPPQQTYHGSAATQSVGSDLATRIVSEMPAPLPDNLKNTYYLLRHGQSTANVAAVISSARSLAYSDRHGVTQLGYDQGKQSAKQLFSLLKDEAKPGEQVIFISSPFARARQTAQACMDGLVEDISMKTIEDEVGIKVSTDIRLEERLMERYFGRLDAEAIYTYGKPRSISLQNLFQFV